MRGRAAGVLQCPLSHPCAPTGPRFALIGDCTASKIARVAAGRGLAFVGGPIRNGAALERDFFDLDGTTFVPRFDLRSPERYADLLRCGLPILSTVGSNVHRIALDLHVSYYGPRRLPATALSEAVLRQVIIENRTGPLRFYRVALERGCSVYTLHSSQRFPKSYGELARRLEAIFLGMLLDAGVELIDVRRETTDAAGALRPEYFNPRAEDHTHANDEWAGLVLSRFLDSAGVVAGRPA